MHIQRTPGQLPEFWDRSVIFFANLLSLFYGNEGGEMYLKNLVTGIDTYGGRLAPILDLMYRGGNNFLILHRKPDPALLDYFRSMGLGLPTIIEAPDAIDALTHSEHPDLEANQNLRPLLSCNASWVEGFVTDSGLIEATTRLDQRPLNSIDSSKRGNNKYLLHAHLESKGLPVFETLLAASSEEVPAALEALERSGYRHAVVKSQIGASGVGLKKLRTTDRLEIPEFYFFEGPCMVQGWLDGSVGEVEFLGSPSVQYFLDDERVWLFDLTDQILDHESVHEGNRAPPLWLAEHPELENELFRQAEVAGAWLHDQGYRGTASADFLVVLRSGRPEAYICEINARVTGATYPAVLARHFEPGDAWMMRNLRFVKSLPGQHLLEELERADCLYRPGRSAGILPVNFNLDEWGQVRKGQFLVLAATTDDCLSYFERAAMILQLDWRYDRD